jgi:hypothetical protein
MDLFLVEARRQYAGIRRRHAMPNVFLAARVPERWTSATAGMTDILGWSTVS